MLLNNEAISRGGGGLGCGEVVTLVRIYIDDFESDCYDLENGIVPSVYYRVLKSIIIKLIFVYFKISNLTENVHPLPLKQKRTKGPVDYR